MFLWKIKPGGNEFGVRRSPSSILYFAFLDLLPSVTRGCC